MNLFEEYEAFKNPVGKRFKWIQPNSRFTIIEPFTVVMIETSFFTGKDIVIVEHENNPDYNIVTGRYWLSDLRLFADYIPECDT